MQGGTYFPETRRMLLFSALLIWTHFWPASTLLRGHLALATLSHPETDPQILDRWGCADEVHLGKKIRAKDFGLEFECDVQQPSWIFTRWIGFCMSELFRKIDFGGIMSWKTQPSCRAFDDRRPTGPCHNSWQVSRLTSGPSVVTFVMIDNRLPYAFHADLLLQHGYCTFVTMILRPFSRLFINLAMCIWALFPKAATTLGLVEQAFWRVPSFTKWVIASSSKVILAGPSRRSTTGTSASGTSGSRWFFRSFCCMKEFGDGFDGVIFPRLSISWRKLQLSPFTHCPLASHCQQSPRVLCTRCFVPWFLTTTSFSKFPLLAPKFLFRFSCSILLFTIVFNLSQPGRSFFWWISRSYNSNTVLSFSESRILNLYNPSKMSSGGIFVIDTKNSVPLWIEFLNIVISKTTSE